MTREQVRNEIKAACQQRGWTPLDLARESRVSPNAIQGFLEGREEISPPVLHRLRETLALVKRS